MDSHTGGWTGCRNYRNFIGLRVRDDFLAITTIGINFVAVAVFQYVPYLGAAFGMTVKKPMIFGEKMGNIYFLIIVLVLIVGVIYLSKRMEKSWIGLALCGIRNNTEAAASLGIDVNKEQYMHTICLSYIQVILLL